MLVSLHGGSGSSEKRAYIVRFHLKLCNLSLILSRLQSCRSHIEVLEGLHEFVARERGERYERGDRALLRVCGPSVREARDPSGRFLIRQAVTSKGANLTILVRRAASQTEEEEFVDGAFAFHDGKYVIIHRFTVN